MTLIEVYDAGERLAWQFERQSDDAAKTAREITADLLRGLGIVCHNREPGLPEWTYGGSERYFATPRDAVIAMQEAGQG